MGSESKQVGVIKSDNYPGLFGEQMAVIESKGKKISGDQKKPRYFLKGTGFVVHVNSMDMVDKIFGNSFPEPSAADLRKELLAEAQAPLDQKVAKATLRKSCEPHRKSGTCVNNCTESDLVAQHGSG